MWKPGSASPSPRRGPYQKVSKPAGVPRFRGPGAGFAVPVLRKPQPLPAQSARGTLCCTVCWSAVSSRPAPGKTWGCTPVSPPGWQSTPALRRPSMGASPASASAAVPEVTDPGCACAWLFRLKGENSPAATGEFAGLSGKHGENFRQNDG